MKNDSNLSLVWDMLCFRLGIFLEKTSDKNKPLVYFFYILFLLWLSKNINISGNLGVIFQIELFSFIIIALILMLFFGIKVHDGIIDKCIFIVFGIIFSFLMYVSFFG